MTALHLRSLRLFEIKLNINNLNEVQLHYSKIIRKGTLLGKIVGGTGNDVSPTIF